MNKLEVLVVMTLSLVRACGSDTEASVEVAPTAFAMTASHGGSVLFVENGWVEVVPKSDGTIEAYVLDSGGAPLATPMTTQVSVKVRGDDGAPHQVELPWNPASSRFEGHLVRVHPEPGPLEVVVVVAGQPRWHAVAPRVAVVTPPRPPITGNPRDALVGPDMEVDFGRPNLLVEVPPRHGHHGHPGHGEHGVAGGPDGPGFVVIAPPRPGVVVVQPGGHGGRGRGHEGRGRGHGGRGRGHGRGHH